MNVFLTGDIMPIYMNLGGTSGVRSYEAGPDFIRVQFQSGTPYLYTHQSAGQQNVEHMKRLAESGRGLNSFINQTPAVKLWVREVTAAPWGDLWQPCSIACRYFYLTISGLLSLLR